MYCNARVLKDLHIFPNTKLTYHTTEQCNKQTLRKIAIDSGDSQMSICLCCFRRYATRIKPESTWYGWYDCSYPSNARVVGSQWYYDTAASVTTADDASEDSMSELCEEMGTMAISQDEVPILELPVEEVQAQAQAPEEAPAPTKEEKKAALKARIKEIQAVARPDKMTLKEIQAAFKEITDLKTQIHML